MINILYLGAFPPNFLVQRSGGKIDSFYRASQSLIKGFRNLPDINLKVITSPDIVSFPKGPFFINKEYNKEEDLTLVSSLNISFVKQPWTIVSMTREAVRHIRHCEGKVVVLIPYMVFRHVFTLRLVSKLYPQKTIQACIVPDVFFPTKWIHKKVNKLTELMASKFDAFVLYTAKMAEYLHIKTGHYEVVEGFREVLHRKPESGVDFKVVYAGSLNIHYGVGRLVEAMRFIDDPEVQLHLFGAGSAEQMIHEAIKDDKRIVYHGKVPNDKATDAIYSASALINPRNASDGEFTDYSFPSKDIEYMSTGIPTLLCKLPGMPVEYYGHFVDLGEATPKQIAEGIIKVKQMKQSERDAIGQDARVFIFDRMDNIKQAERIVEMFNKFIKQNIKPTFQ